MGTLNIYDTPAVIRSWHQGVEPRPLADVVANPDAVGIFSADMINGFLYEGPLASPRVAALASPVVSLVDRAWTAGVRNVVLMQDTHSIDTPEFASYPPHCVAGSDESRTIPELAALPYSDQFRIVEKNNLNPAIGTVFDDWLAEHDQIRTAIVVGDCTDLCTYQLAMHLRMRANALDIQGYEVIVPEDCVATFDTPEHPGDFFHVVFLYHMAMNGIRVVRSLT